MALTVLAATNEPYLNSLHSISNATSQLICYKLMVTLTTRYRINLRFEKAKGLKKFMECNTPKEENF